MRFRALCCDYDGTLADHGTMAPATIAALERVNGSGRQVVLVTGRQLEDLRRVVPRLDLFACVVAENGALLYWPATRRVRLLAAAPSAALVAALKARGATPLSIGRAIVATHAPHAATVAEVLRDLGLALRVIFNKGAVMVLPAGVDKATGLQAALHAMGLAPAAAIGVGDAENDLVFLELCSCSVAVANALPAVKQAAHIVTAGANGLGVSELIEELLADDLARCAGNAQGG